MSSLIKGGAQPSAPPADYGDQNHDWNHPIKATPVHPLEQDLGIVKQQLMDLFNALKAHDGYLVHIKDRVENLESAVRSRETRRKGYEEEPVNKKMQALQQEMQRIKAMLRELKNQPSKKKKKKKKKSSWLKF